MNLVYRNEKSLFALAAIISILFWLSLIIFTWGVALIYVFFAFIAYLFAQSGFISHLKGNGVKVTETQYPDIHNSLIACCQKVGLDTAPEIYLLRTDYFNALATKFMGRNFVVLFTDVVDALSDEPDAIDFYVGHELGHIHRKHLTWSAFLFPALLLPVLGTAYRRAQEYTCDRYGAQCCKSDDHVSYALAAMVAGNTRWKKLDTVKFLEQIPSTSGFWMSFHEYISDYPWLTKRTASALAFRRNEEIRLPRRNFFAGFLSIFVPRIVVGGGVSVLFMVAIVAILVALAVPAYQDYTIRAKVGEAINSTAMAKLAIAEYATTTGGWPTSLTEVGFDDEVIPVVNGDYTYTLYDEGMLGIYLGEDEGGTPQYVVLEPSLRAGSVEWSCYGQNAVEKYLPSTCRTPR